MKRILVISDIHYPTRIKNIESLLMLLSKLKSIDAIIGCGDYVCDEIVQILRSEYKESYLVIGNMDQLCENLPININIEIENFKIGITHGAGAPFGIKKRILSEFVEKPDIIFFGHTHE
ncbi:MAG TPA: YfcE family phosphodiesterase, partial [Exilispira sp.]|nr:YfcE family phosphodiesterase [Exilispira sp.]